MDVVFIPGAMRSGAQLAHWRTLLAGHQVSFAGFPASSVSASVDVLAGRIPKDALVVGESVGGLLALGLAGHGFRAIAVDPPLTMAKQWTASYALRTAASAGRVSKAFIAEVFGLMPNGSVEERVYYPLLYKLAGPVDIVTGDVPLWPCTGMPGRQCMIDGADRYVLKSYPLVRLREISGPHALLDESREACRDIILEVAHTLQDVLERQRAG